MLTLYRTVDCPDCEEVASHLKELRLAHKVLQIERGEIESGHFESGRAEEGAPAAGGSWPAGVPSDAQPPILADGGELFVGSQEIGKHLAQIARINDRWQQHGSDACFCDPDGEIL